MVLFSNDRVHDNDNDDNEKDDNENEDNDNGYDQDNGCDAAMMLYW